MSQLTLELGFGAGREIPGLETLVDGGTDFHRTPPCSRASSAVASALGLELCRFLFET